MVKECSKKNTVVALMAQTGTALLSEAKRGKSSKFSKQESFSGKANPLREMRIQAASSEPI